MIKGWIEKECTGCGNKIWISEKVPELNQCYECITEGTKKVIKGLKKYLKVNGTKKKCRVRKIFDIIKRTVNKWLK
jgi:hypothetical protein